MAYRILTVVLGMIAAASPLAAANVEPAPAPVPVESADGKYCLRVDAFTGSRVETIKCWTREEWADQGVDVDKEWAKNGVERTEWPSKA